MAPSASPRLCRRSPHGLSSCSPRPSPSSPFALAYNVYRPRIPKMSSSSPALFVLASLFLAGAAAAQDVVTVGTATAHGPTVDVPVFIRDAAGTPLGVDRPAGSKIQSFSIKVTYAPASAVTSVTFSRAGITAGLTPAFEAAPATSGSISLLESFQETTNPIPFTSNASLPADQIAHLVFTLSSSATPGSSLALTLDSST